MKSKLQLQMMMQQVFDIEQFKVTSEIEELRKEMTKSINKGFKKAIKKNKK